MKMRILKLNAAGRAARKNDENRRIKLLLDASPLACRLWKRNYEIFECNEEALRLFGIKNKQEFMDHYCEYSPEFQPDGKNSREKTVEVVDAAFANGHLVLEWLYKLPDGTEIPCEITLVRVKYEDDYVVAGYSRDLREYKKMMEAVRESAEKLEDALADTRRANEAKSDFLASMSHEMRTPLNAVIGLSGLCLENSGLDADIASNLEKIYSSGEMLLRIVNDILDISKIEAGRMELVEYEYDVPSLINDAVTQNSLMIGEKDVELKLDVESDLFARLYGDELRVKQIINNLLSNAVKYTEAGFVELGVRCVKDGGLVWVTITVSDTGVGIRAEDMGELFKDYTQLNLKDSHRAESTGLGLPIARSLAEMMQGEIAVESEYGKGSVFTVKLAQQYASDTRIGNETAESLKGFRYTGDKRNRNARVKRVGLPYARVLVVDDNLTNLDVARGLMKPYGMKVDCATGGRQAVDAVRKAEPRYNAIFMDHMMPGVDGVEATRMIREEIGTDYAKNVPIIALTANALAGSETMFLDKGFQAFIPKPIEIGRLDEVIRRWVRDRELEREYEARTGRAFTPEGLIARAGADRRSGVDRRAFGMGISGLDTARGVKRMGGDGDAYYGVLQSFTLNTPTVLDSVEEAGEMDIGLYAAAVHGIKGTCRAIGAEALADIAERLEKAAREGDRAFITNHNPAFIRSARQLIAEIDEMLASHSPVAPKPKKDAPETALLAGLLTACGQYDTDKIDAAISELDAFEYVTGGAFVIALVQNARRFDFVKIMEQLTSYFGAGA